MTTDKPELRREIGLLSATALNMIDMIGVGPFITIPLIISAMGGPQAMLGWILGAALAMCDGMVWAELGAAFPGSGGSYRYLKEIYGPKWGKLFSFLFIWQLSFSAPLSIASGCIGLARYSAYLFPSLDLHSVERTINISLPLVGALSPGIVVGGKTWVAMGACALAVVLLYRRIAIVSWLSVFLWIVVLGTIVWVIVAGLTHFKPAVAFDFPPRAFHLDSGWLMGLGAALLVSAYDYWGYYNVCFLGDEIKEPARNIPRAIVYSICAVAAIYIVMNISILGVMPWRELDMDARSGSHFYVISTMMERLYGHGAGVVASLLIMWTAFASIFSLLLGYSRIPYAAARDGNYFKVFGYIHPVHTIPHVSLLMLGIVAILCCFLDLAQVIAALVVIRIMIQFLVQAIGLLLLRSLRPDAPRPFRMWLYPIPALGAIVGFLFVMYFRPHFEREVRYAIVIIVGGLIVFFLRAAINREWPFGGEGTRIPEGKLSAAHENEAETS